MSLPPSTIATVAEQTADKEQLQKVLQGFRDEYQDNTDYLRENRKSVLLRDDILKMERLKRGRGSSSSEDLAETCKAECPYLYSNFTMLFNKLVKDTVDLRQMFRVLEVLRQIEDGQINQDEGSVIVGKMFADLYLDSAKREGAAIDAAHEAERVERVEGKFLTWKQFKARCA